jgi:multisubunit Na+/H+ antiporter MnhC subunit
MQSIQTPQVAGAVVAWLQSGLSAAAFVLICPGFLLVSQRSFAAKLNILKLTGEGVMSITCPAGFRRQLPVISVHRL